VSVISPVNKETSVHERTRAVASLVERAEIYRARFARVALCSGAVSALVAIGIHLNDETKLTIGRSVRAREFATLWIATFVIEALALLFFSARDARRGGRAFPSPESKLVFNQLKPFPIVPAAFTGWFFTTGYIGAQELNLVVVWIASYGLMLLSLSLFAPRAIIGLGWMVLLTGLSIPVFGTLIETYFTLNIPNLFLGVTFGAYHLIYAMFNWRRRPGPDQAT
jgi:hypothetical protein